VSTETIYEVAEEFRCSPRKISDVARAHGIGMNLKGSAGWRFTATDKDKLRQALRPAKSESAAAPARRRKRRHA
jgi:hypothetical protein